MSRSKKQLIEADIKIKRPSYKRKRRKNYWEEIEEEDEYWEKEIINEPNR